MPARPRKEIVDTTEPGFYHCFSRCVRRAFLCGNDPLTQRSFEHRRGWIVERIKLLSSVFAIDILAYAVLSKYRNAETGELIRTYESAYIPILNTLTITEALGNSRTITNLDDEPVIRTTFFVPREVFQEVASVALE